MFTEHANKAKALSESNKDGKFIFSYTVVVGKRKTAVIEATDMIAARKDFERQYPTAKIYNILQVS